MDKQQPDDPIATQPVASVSATILSCFFDELAKDEQLSDVAPELRKLVLDDGVFAEAAIRAALFRDAL
ncbi:hypothetical protein ACO2I3_12685 [Leptospira interrogans]